MHLKSQRGVTDRTGQFDEPPVDELWVDYTISTGDAVFGGVPSTVPIVCAVLYDARKVK